MSTQTLKSARDKGQNWIISEMSKLTIKTNKFKTLKSGYNKIRPRILPKGLSTYKTNDDDDDCGDNFLKVPQRSRIHSIDVIDDSFRAKFDEEYGDGAYDFNGNFTDEFENLNLNGWNERAIES